LKEYQTLKKETKLVAKNYKNIVFVWELCCNANNNKNDTIVLKLNDDDERLTSVLVVHDEKSSKLLLKKYDNSNKKLETLKQIALRKSEQFITFHIDKNGLMRTYIDCNYPKDPENEKKNNNLNLTIDLKKMLNIKSFDFNENVYVYDNLAQISKIYKCPITTTSVLDGSILYFYDNFNLKNHASNIISFKHDTIFYSICYKNKKIEITKSDGLNSSIEIQLNPEHDFTYGFYLYFKCSSIEIYDTCPSINSLNNSYVGVWNTSIFANKIFIKTFRSYKASNGATPNTLEMFCSNVNLFSSAKNNRCSSINKNVFLFEETSKTYEKYMPLIFNKYLTLLSSSNLEGSIYLINHHTILVASRYNSNVNFFNRSLIEYEEGFTDGQHNFWMGLDNLHKLTNAHDLKFKIVAISKLKTKYVEEYSFVKVTNSSDNYRLILGKLVSGRYGYFAYYNNTQFSTFDYGNMKLAKDYLSGFWHKENKTLCFNCVDDANANISSNNLIMPNGKSVNFFSFKMYLVVRFFLLYIFLLF
jgi:hypothetical protein